MGNSESNETARKCVKMRNGELVLVKTGLLFALRGVSCHTGMTMKNKHDDIYIVVGLTTDIPYVDIGTLVIQKEGEDVCDYISDIRKDFHNRDTFIGMFEMSDKIKFHSLENK